MTVHLKQHGTVVVVTIDNPPVNAMNLAVRQELLASVQRLDGDPSVTAVVLAGAGRAFVGGADITEFDRPVEEPSLPVVIAAIEAARKPWVAAVQGVALGGGLELVLGCHYRLAGPQASFALPEVTLGIIPGAGGTQRLPRLIGVAAAIGVVAENQTLNAQSAAQLGLVARVFDGDLLADAVAFARSIAAMPLPLTAGQLLLPTADAAVWLAAEARISAKSKASAAPLLALAAMRFGVEHGFAAGLAQERATFLRLRASDEAAALRYLFFAERAAPRPADLKGIEQRPIRTAAVIGGGTMGVGIAAALLNADLPVVLVERDAESLARGMTALTGLYAAAQRKGLNAEAAAARLANVTPAVGYAALSASDLVIEAVFEDLTVKRAVFAELAQVCRMDAILATNTSYLSPAEIAVGLAEPSRFIGLHFFSPAHVMKLLEIVPIPETAPDVLAASFALARLLGKIPVRSGICDGFIGNRILRAYRAEAEAMLRNGVSFAQIDAAMRGFGYAMGPFEMQDLAGLDISYMAREAARARGQDVPETPGDLLVRAGRKGQKTGGGWYDYLPGNRKPQPSAEAARLIAPLLAPATEMAADEITARLIGAMAAEGQAILSEGIAASPADIDLVEVHGYGFPRRLGGPMFLQTRPKHSAE